MQFHAIRKTSLCAAAFAVCSSAFAVTEISFWHSMEGELGQVLKSQADQFNQSQKDVKIVPSYKGDYEQSMAAGIAAYRSGKAPDILQVYEVGTASMMASKAIKPVYKVFEEAGIEFDEKAVIPTVAGYYTDSKMGRLLSQPFNSSTPVLYYNKDAFKKAGLNPDQPPKTWQELASNAEKLRAAGMSCGYTSGWFGWIHLENFSAWHGVAFATEDNGFGSLKAKLDFNKPIQVKHIEFLQQMSKKGTFSYYGRKDEPTEKFYNGDCAFFTGSSSSLANIGKHAKFDFGVSFIPYHADVKTAPQNAIIGGASLWVFDGKNAATYRGIAEFFQFLTKPEIAAEWHQKTGYLPITSAASDLTKKQDFYKKSPASEVAIKQMLNKDPLPFTKGLRLGNLPQIRTIVDEEIESIWAGKKTPQQALDAAVQRGEVLLRRFESSVK